MNNSNLIKFNSDNVVYWIKPEKYNEFTNFCNFFLENGVYKNIDNYIIGNYFKLILKYAKDNNNETAFVKANENFIVKPIKFISDFVNKKYLTKNTIKAIDDMDNNITLYVMDKVKNFLLKDSLCKENLFKCVNSFSYKIVSEKIDLNQFIKSELERHISECEPKFKNQLEKAMRFNDSDKFKKLKAIFDEVSDSDLKEAIELCEKHNSRITNELPRIILSKTGEQQNYYTLYKYFEMYDADLDKNIVVSKYLQNVSIDLLKAVKKLISHYPTAKIDLSTDDYKIKSSTTINSQNNPTLTFGKYSGKDILSVCKIDKGYCLWLKKQFEMNKNLSSTQRKMYDIINQIEKENQWEKLSKGGEINNKFIYTIGGL